MIAELYIRNFGIIKEAGVSFSRGFNVITGETGSGKSLLVKSIGFLMGEKEPSGESEDRETVVEAVFKELPDEVINFLEECGVDVSDEIVIRRIAGAKRSRIFVNDRMLSIPTIRILSGMLMEIQSQRESIALFNKKKRVHLFDAFSKLTDKRREYEKLYETYESFKRNLASIDSEREIIVNRIEDIKEFINEVERYDLLKIDEEELKRKRDVLLNAEKLKSMLGNVLKNLSEGEINVYSLLRDISYNLRNASKTYSPISMLSEKVEKIFDELRELELQIHSLYSAIEYDEEEAAKIEEILWRIDKLKNKYKLSFNELLDKYKSAKEEILALEKRLQVTEDMNKEFMEMEKKLRKLATLLSEMRASKKELFEQAVLGYLAKMGLETSEFRVEFEKTENLGPYGFESVNYLFSANPQVKAMPIEKCASGGEISRVMLAVYLAVKKKMGTTLILDEIDTGVGGYTARLIGKLLKELSSENQVIVVTHFPQIAVEADNHIVVEKTLKDYGSYAIIKTVSGKEREKEIERMLGDIENILQNIF